MASPLRAFGSHRITIEGKSNTRRRRQLKDVARQLPRTPGVYFFYGHNNRLLYIGKAKRLRDRVRSYFAETSLKRPPKLRRLLAEIERLEVRHCGSELEALLLERKLIAQLRPILNRQLKRFDVYPYLLLSDETFPRLTLTRAEPVADAIAENGEIEEREYDFFAPQFSSRRNFGGESQHAAPDVALDNVPRAGEIPGLYLGPFTTPRAAWWTFEAVRNLFPLRSCEGDLTPDVNARGCFYLELKRCAGPCLGAIDARAYRQLCDELVQTLHSGHSPQLERMRARMNTLSEEWRFEEAAKIKEQLEAIEHVANRLQRLQRMRQAHNLVIMQPALSPDLSAQTPALPSASTCSDALATESENVAAQSSEVLTPLRHWSAFLVCAGIVRRHVVVCDDAAGWQELKREIDAVFSSPPPVAPFTAKSELDEMMILDRWLLAHGKEACCVWLNERPSRLWSTNAARKCRKWAQTPPLLES